MNRVCHCVSVMQGSLDRLQIPKLALYQIHFPATFPNVFSNVAFVRGLATCQQNGLTEAVGVSNFNEERLREAHQTLMVCLDSCIAMLMPTIAAVPHKLLRMFGLHVNGSNAFLFIQSCFITLLIVCGERMCRELYDLLTDTSSASHKLHALIVSSTASYDHW